MCLPSFGLPARLGCSGMFYLWGRFLRISCTPGKSCVSCHERLPEPRQGAARPSFESLARRLHLARQSALQRAGAGVRPEHRPLEAAAAATGEADAQGAAGTSGPLTRVVALRQQRALMPPPL